MTPLLRFADWIDSFSATISAIVQWSILLSILVSAGNAIIRKLIPNYSSNMLLELQWYLFGAAFMLAAANTLRQNDHIRIDIVYGMFSRRGQHWIDLLGHILFLMPFCLVMTWLLVPYATDSVFSNEQSTNAGGLPIWPARIVLALGFMVLTLQGIAEIIKKIGVMMGLIPDPTPFISSHEAALKEAEMTAAEIQR